MFCSKCGTKLSDNSKFCQSCGAKVEAVPESTQSAEPSVEPASEVPQSTESPVETISEAPQSIQSPVATASAAPKSTQPPTQSISIVKFPATIIIGLGIVVAGAIMMLIALAFDWYTLRASGYSESYNFNPMSNSDILEYLDLTYAGSGLPLVFMIIFSVIILVAVLYSFLSGKLLARLWKWLGSLCIILLVINVVSILVEVLTADTGDTMYITPHAGLIIALIGAAAVIYGSRRLKVA